MSNSELNEVISGHLKLARFKRKLSQEEAAKLLDISRNTYSMWENNPIKLNISTYIKLCNTLETDYKIFFLDSKLQNATDEE